MGHRSEQLTDLTGEVSTLATRTVKDMELGSKASKAKSEVIGFVEEMTSLAKHAFKR